MQDPQHTLPQHVAIIMDGNGRWAQQRGIPRSEGHSKGLDAVQEAIETATELGIRYLTLYAFSTENWQRPAEEVATLMELIVKAVALHCEKLASEGVKLRIIGSRDMLSPNVLEAIERAEVATAKGERLGVQVAINYGARQEIVHAARALAQKALRGEVDPNDISEELLTKHLYTAGIPDPDLLIRTSGELRISNFLLWQIAYAELLFLPVLWPDFKREHFLHALNEFALRQRRYGGR